MLQVINLSSANFVFLCISVFWKLTLFDYVVYLNLSCLEFTEILESWIIIFHQLGEYVLLFSKYFFWLCSLSPLISGLHYIYLRS